MQGNICAWMASPFDVVPHTFIPRRRNAGGGKRQGQRRRRHFVRGDVKSINSGVNLWSSLLRKSLANNLVNKAKKVRRSGCLGGSGRQIEIHKESKVSHDSKGMAN